MPASARRSARLPLSDAHGELVLEHDHDGLHPALGENVRGRYATTGASVWVSVRRVVCL